LGSNCFSKTTQCGQYVFVKYRNKGFPVCNASWWASWKSVFQGGPGGGVSLPPKTTVEAAIWKKTCATAIRLIIGIPPILKTCFEEAAISQF
jgi:hypothetical protein